MSEPPNMPLQPTHSAVTPLACATGAPAGGRLNGGVRRQLTRSLAFALYLLLSVAALAQPAVPPLRYSDVDRTFYSTIVATEGKFPEGLAIVGPDTVYSPHDTGSASVTKTDATLVPYDREEAHITITTDLGKPVFLLVRSFRLLRVRWINERLLFLDRDMGHVLGIEEIFDVVDRKWLFQKSVEYR